MTREEVIAQLLHAGVEITERGVNELMHTETNLQALRRDDPWSDDPWSDIPRVLDRAQRP